MCECEGEGEGQCCTLGRCKARKRLRSWSELHVIESLAVFGSAAYYVITTRLHSGSQCSLSSFNHY
jgi:hypothetical protein